MQDLKLKEATNRLPVQPIYSLKMPTNEQSVGRTYSSEAGYPPEVQSRVGSLSLDVACLGLLVRSPAARRP